AVRTQPTLSSGMSARIAEAAALFLSYFRKTYRSSYETSSSSSLSLPIRKRYRGTFELILDTNDESSSSDDEGHGLDDDDHGLDDEGHGLEDKGPETYTFTVLSHVMSTSTYVDSETITQADEAQSS
nr:hypothetical protein [Tanacetum cinerariifolium]